LVDGRSGPLGIVLELERVHRTEGVPQLAPAALVREELDVAVGGEPGVEAALRADPERALELLPEHEVVATVALDPGIGRDLAPFADGRAGFSFLPEPGHTAPGRAARGCGQT